MNTTQSKFEAAFQLSAEILDNIENNNLTFELILLKCKKLARLRDDLDALNWISAELHGYSTDLVTPGVTRDQLEQYAERSGRYLTQTDPTTKAISRSYYTSSVPEIEAIVHANQVTLENLKPPADFTPAIAVNEYDNATFGKSRTEYVVEKFQDVLGALNKNRSTIGENIAVHVSLLSRIKNNVYNYVLAINYQLRFEGITESIFQTVKVSVDKRLQETCPNAIKKFVAAYNRLDSDNREEWSQAMSSCRNILKDFADYVFPAQKESYIKKSGETLVVTDDKYKNRLLAFIDRAGIGDHGKFIASRTADLEVRIHALNDMLSQGTHAGLEKQDVKICVLDTYLLLGSLISVI